MQKGKLMSIERKPLNSLCATLCYALGIEPPKQANEKNPFLAEYIDSSFLGKKVDRLVMYNPDAVAEWIFRKYPYLLEGVLNANGFELPLESPMPSVTPVCFGTMYTGAEPSVHGIEKYEKKLITIDTFFDALVRAGKKVAICSQSNCSMSVIYLEREIDYFIYPTVEEINAKALELIAKDEYDVLVVYNTNYDYIMHKNGPESTKALAELRLNGSMFGTIYNAINNCWKNKHDTLLGFAMDHGCHEIDGDSGSHGLDMDEDRQILHTYKAIVKE